MAYRLQPSEPAGREIARVIGEQIARAIEHVNRRRVPLAERIHIARTTCKKIRAALRLVRSVRPGLWRRENVWFRDAARECSALRDATVLPATVAALSRRSRGAGASATWTGVRRRLERQRRAVWAEPAHVARVLARFCDALREAARRWEQQEIDASAADLIDEGFGESYRRARRAWRALDPEAPARAWHEWRKRTKAHAHHCHLFREAWPPVMRAWYRQLAALGELLGAEHDLAVLATWLAAHADPKEKQALSRRHREAIERRRQELRVAAWRVGERLFAEKPSAVIRRLSRWWETAPTLA